MHSRVKYVVSLGVIGTIGLFVRNIPLASQEIALYRALIAIVVLLGVQAAGRRRIRFSQIKKDLPLLFLSGVFMGADWILFFESYKYTTVALTTLSYYFAPILVVAGSAVLFRERLTAKNVVCFLCATCGLVLVIGVSGGGGSNDLLGIAFGLAAAVFYAAIILVNKKIKNVSGIDRTFLQFISAAVVLTPYVAATCGFNLGRVGGQGLVCLLAVGVIHTGVCYCLYFSSITRLPGQQVAILGYADPLVAVLVSALVLGESMTPMQYVGGGAILVFACLNEVRLKKRREGQELPALDKPPENDIIKDDRRVCAAEAHGAEGMRESGESPEQQPLL